MNMLNRDVGTGELCDNIGLVGVSAKWSYITILLLGLHGLLGGYIYFTVTVPKTSDTRRPCEVGVSSTTPKNKNAGRRRLLDTHTPTS